MRVVRKYTYCTCVAPGCHGMPYGFGVVVSRHIRLDLAIRKAKQSDRLVVLALHPEGWPTGDILYQLEIQSHPALGHGRFGRGL